MLMTAQDLLPKVLEKSGLLKAKRHLFLCLGPDCCSPELGQASWDFLKEQVKNHDLLVMRTRAACFRICSQGPILVVYPEGIWYGRVTPERLKRIIEEHIIHGQPVSEWIISENSLG